MKIEQNTEGKFVIRHGEKIVAGLIGPERARRDEKMAVM